MVEGVKKTPKKKTVTGLPVNTEAAFCYLGFWVTGLIFLLVEKDNKFIRFHAMQSLVTFGAINVLIIFTNWILFPLSPLIGLASFVIWLVLIFKAYQKEEFELPLVGDFVRKQLK